MVVRQLRDEGVKYIYGYPGGALLHVYDGDLPSGRFEQYSGVVNDRPQPIWLTVIARASGKAGVC